MNVRSSSLMFLVLAHCLVDTFASLLAPLWPALQDRVTPGTGSGHWAYVTWSLSTSVSQLFFGYWGDRGRSRWLIWAGPALGVVCLSAIGFVHSLAMLNVLLIVGGLGIAAFHPEAAALAGASAPGSRSRAMSLFAVGGSIGQAAGPIYSGIVTTRYGLPALAWSAAWGLGLLALLRLGMGNGPVDSSERGDGRALDWREILRERGGAMGLVLLIGVLRVVAILGVPIALAFALKARGEAYDRIGLAQGVFLAGNGAGSLACAMFARRAGERRVLWALPLPLVPLLWFLPAAGFAALLAGVGVAGMLLGATMPILVSYGQQLLPEGRRTASSITMGVTWGLGGLIVAALLAACERVQRPELAFTLFAVACLASSTLCAWLPEPEPHERPRVLIPRPQPR
jgi:FSR family fosmidomycin resistance protein-like MFS transporter